MSEGLKKLGVVNRMKKKQLPIFSIVLYILSALVMVYAIWAFVSSYQTISDAIAAGQLSFKESMFDVISYYMTNSVQYVMFAVLIFSAGWIGGNLITATAAKEEVMETAVSQEIENENNDNDVKNDENRDESVEETTDKKSE